MSWDQSTSREDEFNFLLRYLGIDARQLLTEAIEAKLAERGLSYSVEEDLNRVEGDGMFAEFHPQIVRLSSGETFVETLVELSRGDDWGHDHYGFVKAGEEYAERHENHESGEAERIIKKMAPMPDACPSNMTRRDKQIAHIKENLALFQSHAGDDRTVEDYWDDYFTKWEGRNSLYERVCCDLDLEPRSEALYNDEP